jgi:hypothetical protein
MPVEPEDPLKRPEVLFGVGCLVALAAIAGSLILVFLVAFALQPPAWVQVLLGIALIGGGAVLGLVVAKALGMSPRGPGGPRKLPDDGAEGPG